MQYNYSNYLEVFRFVILIAVEIVLIIIVLIVFRYSILLYCFVCLYRQ